MKNTVAIFCILAFLCIIPMPNHALEVETHKAINEYIAIGTINGFSLDSYLKNQLGFRNGVKEEFKFGDSKKVWTWIGDGGKTEDKPPGFFQIPYLRSTNHFHDPVSNQGFGGLISGLLFKGESSIQWSLKPIGAQSPGGHYSWFDTRDYYYKALTSEAKTDRDKYFTETFRGLGQLMHLVQDISVPAHARNQFHVGYDYEKFVLRYQSEVEFNLHLARPYQFDQSLLNGISPLAPIPFANLFDSEKYTGSNPGDTLNNNIGLSEYTNTNFFSDRTIFKNYPHPKKENTNAILKEEEAEDGEIDRKYYISGYQSENLALYSYFANPAPELPGEWKYNLDDTVHKDYAQKLIPRAVGYSAGLLNYFFRGQLDVRQSDTKPDGKIEITITNLSDDPLVTGDFELYYDNKDGEREKINLSSCSVVNLRKYDPEKPETIFKTTFYLPTNFDPKKQNEYMLVYRGKLGREDMAAEEGAVIGKYGFIGRVLPVMATYDPSNKILFQVARPVYNPSLNRDFYIDLAPVFTALGHYDIRVFELKIVEYDGMKGVLVYTINTTTDSWDFSMWGMGDIRVGYNYCVLSFEVLDFVSPEVTYGGYKKRDFAYAAEQFSVGNSVIDSIPPTPQCLWGIPGRPLGIGYHYYQRTRDTWTWGLATGPETTPLGYHLRGTGLYSDFFWNADYYADHTERDGVHIRGGDRGAGPQTVAIPIGVSVWMMNKQGHLADIKWGIHFSCLAGYTFYLRGTYSYHNEWEDEGQGEGVQPWRHFCVPFVLLKEIGTGLALQDPMGVFSVPWVVDDAISGPVTGGVLYSSPGEIPPPPETGGTAPGVLHYSSTYTADGRWPGSYRNVYPVLDANGVLSKYAVHSTRLRYSESFVGAFRGEEQFIDVYPIAVVETGNLRLGNRPPGFYFRGFLQDGITPYPPLGDSVTYRTDTKPNGVYVHHSGGGNAKRMMFRIAPMSAFVPSYTPESGKDRSVYVINDRVYDYLDPVPLLYDDSKVSRELLAAQSIYGMDNPPLLDSTLSLSGAATLTGRMEGYFDLEGYDGDGYFSDFGVIKQSAASEQ